MTNLESLKQIHDVQGQDGTWNCDPYNQGLYNGLEMALATMEGREPVFKQPPEVWLFDLPESEVANPEQGEVKG